MAFEIDFLPVGNGDKSGDRIAFRIINTNGEQKVFVIDGGFNETADELVSHINTYYGTNTVDYVICSHPDLDHASGLQTILEKMDVKNFITHLPWEHAEDVKSKIKNNVTTTGLENKLEKSLKTVSNLEDTAISKGINIIQPFAGLELEDGIVKVLGPSDEYYKELLPYFDEEIIDPKKDISILGMMRRAFSEAKEWIQDNIGINLLDDDDSTSPKNNSSTVILLDDNTKKVLFTADTGKRGLEKAIDFANSKNIDLTDMFLLQVPHHGSKRNFGKTAMSKLGATYACISVSKDSSKHPSKKVTNHLHKMGIKWVATKEITRCFYSPQPFSNRDGWTSIDFDTTFHNSFED